MFEAVFYFLSHGDGLALVAISFGVPCLVFLAAHMIKT
jgi:hypothetical protein